MDYPKIFDSQPQVTDRKLKSLEKRGLVVPSFSEREYTRHPKPDQPNYTVDVSAPVRNRNAGDVVDYLKLSDALMYDLVGSDDAKILVLIELGRSQGPRETHITRLVKCILKIQKAEIRKRIKAWDQKQK